MGTTTLQRSDFTKAPIVIWTFRCPCESTYCFSHPPVNDPHTCTSKGTNRASHASASNCPTEHSCQVDTLNLFGAQLESAIGARIGANVRLSLDLPDLTVETQARVLSSERRVAASSAHYRVVVEFTAMSESARADLRRFLREQVPDHRDEIGEQSQAPVRPKVEPAVLRPIAASRRPRWILPTAVALLAGGTMLTGTASETTEALAPTVEWLQTHTGAVVWSLKALGGLAVAIGAYLGFSRLGERPTP